MKLQNDHWIKISEEVAFKGYRTILTKKFILPNGKKRDFEIVKGQNIVCTFALTPERKVILVRQYRPGPEKMFYDLPAGHMEKNETPMQGAARELLEETGYEGNMVLLGEGYASAYTTAYRYHFLATECVKIAEPNLDPTEFLEVSEMELSAFFDKLSMGFLSDFSDVATCFFALKHLNCITIKDPGSKI